MRFSNLSLERYGRFEDCKLTFRAGAPDLHIVYGANEAGKTTTLAAVSDLLFGFGQRTPFNFRFDYSLLRVGAVLEEDGRAFACRRRKSGGATLVDADDRAVDEGVLSAMLRGQTRDTFRLAFSLDHHRLREGGEAIVRARDDIGQTLFAAGSGMTGIAAALTALDAEADAIWGRRAAARRAYTIAERQWQDSGKQLRDTQLKPRIWTDAQAALRDREKDVADLEAARDALLGQRRTAERLRRIGPAARRRAQVVGDLSAHAATVALTPQRETMAETAMVATEVATRARLTAEALLAELDTRAAALDPDDALLAAGPRIDVLIERRGVLANAAHEAVGLRTEAHIKQACVAVLRRELGTDAAVPSRLAVATLREQARRHAEADARHGVAVQARADLLARRNPLQSRLADARLSDDLPALVAAIDVARSLGADADARCAGGRRQAARADADARAALARLAPWVGTADALAALPSIDDGEITAEQDARARLRTARDAEAADIARIDADLARLADERDALARGGGAIPADAVDAARGVRDAQWRTIREHLCGGAQASDSTARGDAFGQALADADDIADRRFASAEASGRLAALDAQQADRVAAREAARARLDATDTRLEQAGLRWGDRLREAGLPPLEPVRLRAWAADRAAATAAHAFARAAADQADADARRRDEARRVLVALLPKTEPASDDLASVLRQAETLRTQGEARAQAYRDDRLELRGLDDALAGEARRLADAAAERDRHGVAWNAAQAEAGLDLAIDRADARLALFDELRAEVDEADRLATRLNAIDADAQAFAADVAALADDFALAPAPDPAARLEAARVRLGAARVAAHALAELAADRARRRAEIDTAAAGYEAALHSLAPVLADIGGDLAALPMAIESSRAARARRADQSEAERQILADGDGYPLADLLDAWAAEDPDQLAGQALALDGELSAINARITAAAAAQGDARRVFAELEGRPGAAADAASDVAAALAEMAAQADSYLLKRAQAVTLRWAMERHRERRQDPLLLRAGTLFRRLTLGRYAALRVDVDAAAPRLLGVREDGRTVVDVDAMSQGTTDQLFLALRLAAVEQSVAAGVRLPFLADDLFVNFDDDRARAGFEVLADLARATQVLFFTHHAHLGAIARDVVGATVHSECSLG